MVRLKWSAFLRGGFTAHLWAARVLVCSPGGALAFSLPTTTHPHLPPSPSFHSPTRPRLPLTHPPPSKSRLKLMHTFEKNRLKRLKIKQGTTSKVNCILFNRLLSKVLLNKSGLVRGKAGNCNLKSLNRCLSNYYQVRTWPVFAETVTYFTGICPYIMLLKVP